MSNAHPNNGPHLQEYLRLLDQNAVHCNTIEERGAGLRTTFIPTRPVKDKLREKDYNFLRDLLDEVYAPSRPPVNARDVYTKCPKVFMILLCLGKGNYINFFMRDPDLQDRRLPFVGHATPAFPNLGNVEFEDFQAKQWQFCSETMTSLDDQEFRKEDILPFRERQWISGGASAGVYKVKIHEDYDELSRRIEGGGTTTSPDHCYAIKTYTGSEAPWYYEREVNAFRNLSGNSELYPSPSMIGFYGCYVHQETYNVVLEFADGGTLEQFFQDQPPPTTGSTIIAFWSSLFEVTKALLRLHEQELSENDQSCEQILQGWHQDIKPANVLVVKRAGCTPYEWSFKLADLGLSHFTRVTSRTPEGTVLHAFGTKTYGPPECAAWSAFSEVRRQRVKRSVDIWSLGCVFNEAAVWAVNGFRGEGGLEAFRWSRAACEDKRANFRGGDCFHNGLHLRRSVVDFNENLRQSVRENDYITGPVLFQMIGPMLRESPSSRPSAEFVYAQGLELASSARTYVGENNRPGHHPGSPLGGYRRYTYGEPTDARSMPWNERNELGDLTHNNGRRDDPNTTNLFGRPVASPKSTKIEEFGHRPNSPFHHRDGHPSTSQTERYSGSKYNDPQRSHSTRKPRPDRKHTAHGRSISGDSVDSRAHMIWSLDTVGGRLENFALGSGSKPGLGESPDSIGDHGGIIHQVTTPQQDPVSVDQVEREAIRVPSSGGKGSARTPQEGGKGATAEKSRDLTQEQVPPRLSVPELKRWQHNRGKSSLDNESYREYLKGRDHVFIVDDAGSMDKHWPEVEGLIGPLAYFLKECDPDGVDLYFMTDTRSVHARRNQSYILRESLKDVKRAGSSDPRPRLRERFDEYSDNLRREKAGSKKWWKSNTRVRPLSIYVFTDGIWQYGSRLDDIIENFVRDLESHGKARGQVGLQFIQFGDNPDATKRLEFYDNELGDRIGMDMIDTERATDGNVWKMLHGAINPWFDGE